MSGGSSCRKRRGMWLRNEVGIRVGQAASSSPTGLGGLGKSGAGHGPDSSVSPPGFWSRTIPQTRGQNWPTRGLKAVQHC